MSVATIEITDLDLVKEMKPVTRKIYFSIVNRKGKLKINDRNYGEVKNRCDLLFDKILTPLNTYRLNKSLFLDFLNFQLQVNYCFEMIIQKEMNNKEIHELMSKEKDYLDYTYHAIIDTDFSSL